MAVFTPLSLEQATEVARAHGLPPPDRVEPVAAGSVNSNFFIVSDALRWFLRIYEEQEADGVAYEWALLDHLRRAGLPVPARVQGPGPGAVRVAGKPVAIFELVGGHMSCQAGVTEARAEAVGHLLAACHRATANFGVRRQGRFTLDDVAARLDQAAAAGQRELEEPIGRLRAALAEVRSGWPSHLPTGVIHGDLFRDNVHWEDDRVVAVIDWESASDGALVYDLAVTLLAWCYGDAFDWRLARAMARGYEAERPTSPAERSALRLACIAAATRFAATRITDFHLREGVGERVHKDYRRFLERLSAISALGPEELAARLFGG